MQAAEEIKNEGEGQNSNMTEKEQKELAFALIVQNGLPGVVENRPETLSVADYSTQEKHDDEVAVDWDTAFGEVEQGESAKQSALARQHSKQQQEELDRQKNELMQQMQAKN